MDQRLYIHTIGCQMNVYDSEQMAMRLALEGFYQVDSPDDADLVVVNTCAIRAKAEQKVFSYLGRLAGLKKKNPDLLVAVGGCVAQQEGARIVSRQPAVDIVFGTHAIDQLPQMVFDARRHHRPVVDVQMGSGIYDAVTDGPEPQPEAISRFVTIMQGCDNHCSYCVVPHVRGPEISKPPDKIVAEVRHWVQRGTREVTLLGQNVNSYGQKGDTGGFAGLLERLNRLDGLLRIRFTTSHPKDLSDALVGVFGRLEKLCGHIHLPVQSGDDTILKRMNRRYSRKTYLQRVESLRAVRPDIAITSDFIVGFPQESEAQFEQTLDLMKTVRFDAAFVFRYSDRPNAPAAHFKGKVSESVKQQRLERLLELQERHTMDKHRQLVGTVQTVLVEGKSKRENNRKNQTVPANVQWSGRTGGNKIVNFIDDTGAIPLKAGQLAAVKIEKALAHSLWGRVCEPMMDPAGKGAQSHAA